VCRRDEERVRQQLQSNGMEAQQIEEAIRALRDETRNMQYAERLNADFLDQMTALKGLMQKTNNRETMEQYVKTITDVNWYIFCLISFLFISFDDVVVLFKKRHKLQELKYWAMCLQPIIDAEDERRHKVALDARELSEQQTLALASAMVEVNAARLDVDSTKAVAESKLKEATAAARRLEVALLAVSDIQSPSFIASSSSSGSAKKAATAGCLTKRKTSNENEGCGSLSKQPKLTTNVGDGDGGGGLGGSGAEVHEPINPLCETMVEIGEGGGGGGGGLALDIDIFNRINNNGGIPFTREEFRAVVPMDNKEFEKMKRNKHSKVPFSSSSFILMF